MEAKGIANKEFREKHDFHWLEKINKDAERKKMCDSQSDMKYKRKLRYPLYIGEIVLVLAGKLKKKDTPRRLY